jgi:hypothetical protein
MTDPSLPGLAEGEVRVRALGDYKTISTMRERAVVVAHERPNGSVPIRRGAGHGCDRDPVLEQQLSELHRLKEAGGGAHAIFL